MHALKYNVVLWSEDSEDWKFHGQNLNFIKNGVGKGSIILQHDIFYETILQQEQIIQYFLRHHSPRDFVTIDKCLNVPAYKLK